MTAVLPGLQLFLLFSGFVCYSSFTFSFILSNKLLFFYATLLLLYGVRGISYTDVVSVVIIY